jgi:hypothetical protein
MTTNIYLNNLLHPLCASYGGCFSCDTIPPVDSPTNFIVNLSKEAETGTHFVALIIKEQAVFYFDSFGLPCTNDQILLYMRNLSRKIVYNKMKVQDITSKMCGFYCALLMLRNDIRCKQKSDLYFHSDSDLLHLNDKLCTDYICEAIARMGPKSNQA